MFESLQSFLQALDASGELVRISEPVSPILEVTEIAHQHSRAVAAHPSANAAEFDPGHATLGGSALLFENITGCDFPLAINTYGSYRRMEMALGCHERGGFAAIGDTIASLTKPQPPRGIRELIAKAREFLPLLRVPPKTVRRAPCQDVDLRTERGEVRLTGLPIIKCWPLDGDPAAVGYNLTPEQAGTAAGEGRYITLAGIHTIHADDRNKPRPPSHNIGMYRLQLIDDTHLAMHWHMHHDGAAHWRSWKKLGEPMPVAIALGGPSVMPYAATCPLPPGISELLMAGFLHGRGIRMVPCKTVPLRVPAESEIAIEGYVDTDCGPIDFDPRTDGDLGPGAVFEGPFGDHTGFYSLPDRYPILSVTAMTHRRDAVYPTTVVGLPPQEDYYLGKATERIMFPLLKTIIHDIEDYHLPMFGCFHNCAFIRIRKAYPLQARRVMHAVWGAGQMAWTKMIVVVDEQVNVHDERAVLEAIAENTRFDRDLEMVRGPLDILDHAAPHIGAGHKLGIDATSRWPGEDAPGIKAHRHPEPSSVPTVRAAVERLVDQGTLQRGDVMDFGEGRFVFVATDDSGFDTLLSLPEMKGACCVNVDSTTRTDDWSTVLFHMCANADFVRDRRGTDRQFAIDARSKTPRDANDAQWPVRDYPPILTMDPDVRDRVRARAGAFGLDPEHWAD